MNGGWRDWDGSPPERKQTEGEPGHQGKALRKHQGLLMSAQSRAHDCAKNVHEPEPNRWDGFAPWELAALDEFFQNFARLRDYSADIQQLKHEIRASMERRRIKPYW
jgi:hypothetical protein